MKDFEVNTAGFTSSIRRLAHLNGKAQGDLLLSFAKTTLTNPQGTGIIETTPPGAPGVRGPAARAIGERAISRDLVAVFQPVRIKGKRPERWPDVAQIHKDRIHRKAGRHTMGRGRAQAYYVDRTKLAALFRTLRSHVGRLSSGWLVALHRLGGRGPAWIERHAGWGAGDVTIDLSGYRKKIDMHNTVRSHAPAGEMDRRVATALRFTELRIGRAITGTLEAQARRAGFKLAA